MHSILRGVSRTLIYPFAATLFVAVVHAQSVLGPPNEANHFIETPKGWTQPKTPWGDPDIQGMWPISFVGSVPLERCAGGGGRGRAGSAPPPPCDTNKAFLTEAEYQARLDGRRQAGGSPCGGDRRRQLRTGAAVGRHRSHVAAAADLAHRRSAKRQAAGDDGGGQAPVGADEKQLGAARRDADVGLVARLRHLGPLHHARHALVDDAVSLQQRRPASCRRRAT